MIDTLKYTWAIHEHSPTEFYVEERSNLQSNYTLYGPIPDRKTAKKLVEELRGVVEEYARMRIPALGGGP